MLKTLLLPLGLLLAAFAQDASGPWLDLDHGGMAVGSVQGKTPADYGRLENGTLLPAHAPGLERLRADGEGSYGTGFMISLLVNAAADFQRTVDPANIVRVGAISQEHGGFFPPHKGHQNGLDADILYMGQKDYTSVLDKDKRVSSRFNPEKNWAFFRLLHSQMVPTHNGPVTVVQYLFIAPEIKKALCSWAQSRGILSDPQDADIMRRIRPTEGHDDHFHVRLRCSPFHPACKQQGDPGDQIGC